MVRIEKTVFVSYRRADFSWAIAIYEYLTHRGFDVFIDYLGIPSGDFETAILENIKARAHFLVVLTRNALDRCSQENDWLRREIEESIAVRRNVVPLFVEGFSFSDPSVMSRLTGRLAPLCRYNGVNVLPEYFAAAMERLCETFLNVPVETVLHPPSAVAREAVTEQKAALQIDPLTGLINQREFYARVENSLSNAKDRQVAYAIAYLDLDKFRLFDTYGDAASDDILRAVAALLKAKMHARDTLARLHTDHFGILFENASLDEALRACEVLREAVEALKVPCGSTILRVRGSVGVTELSREVSDAKLAVSTAKHACQMAKELGGNRVQAYRLRGLDEARSGEGPGWTKRILNAIQNDGLEILQQRIAGLHDAVKDDVYYEWSVRMVDGQGTALVPEIFADAVSSCGMWPGVDRWVITQALRRLRSPGARPASLNMYWISLSPQSIQDDSLLAYLAEQLQDPFIGVGTLCLELTETCLMENLLRANHFIGQIKLLGCKFAVANFGTGYSSLAYLRNLSPDFLKIDANFTRESLRNRAEQTIIKTITDLAHNLRIKTVAQGVENQLTLELVKHLGVDYAQGYWVARPTAY